MKQETFSVSGMTCAACSAHVERAAAGVAGVEAVSVNLLAGVMQVSFSPPATAKAICAAVQKAGYGATPGQAATATAAQSVSLSTLLSILTLPIMAAVTHVIWQFVGG